MDLADARLGDSQHLAYLLECHLVLVIQGQDQLWPLAEAPDLLDERGDPVAPGGLFGWVDRIRVRGVVGEHGRVVVAVAGVVLVERDGHHGRGLEPLAVSRYGHAESRGDLGFGR